MNTMIDQPSTYFSQWLPPRSDLLKAMEAEAQAEKIPIIGPVVGQLLYLLARSSYARQILELGTATGYSTIFLARACQHSGGQLLTLELDETLARRARDNIARAGMSHVVEVRCADALVALQTIAGPLDMIFMDIEKVDYVRALPACTRLLRAGGLLVADNTGFKDAHAFNQAIHTHPQWEGVNLWSFLPGHSPEHDGVCLAMRV
jgi:predicted O-methyltransferase YrrM